jgi:hypothetical protein
MVMLRMQRRARVACMVCLVIITGDHVLPLQALACRTSGGACCSWRQCMQMCATCCCPPACGRALAVRAGIAADDCPCTSQSVTVPWYNQHSQPALASPCVKWLSKPAGCEDRYGEGRMCFRCLRAEEVPIELTSYALDMGNARNTGTPDM